MATKTVSTSAQLVAALKSAASGDVIKLAAGEYTPITLRDINFAGNVTIQSEDNNHPATITALTIRESSGLTFKNLEMYVAPGKNNPIQASASKNITFDSLDVHGTLDGSPADDASAMLIRNSDNIVIKNSEFQQLWHGVGLLDNTNVTITGNSFHDIRTDGVRGGGNSNLTVSGNYFTDFYPAAGDHPDAIQLWTTNTTERVSNITIADNTIVRGEGAPTQGIFLRDQVGTLPFQNVTITGNALIGTGYNGIAVGHADNLTISDNDVVSVQGMESWIRLDKVNSGTVSNNSAARYIYSTSPNVAKADNLQTAMISLGDVRRLGSWIDAHAGAPTRLANVLQSELDHWLDNIALLDPSPHGRGDLVFTTIERVGTDGADRLKAEAVGTYRLIGGDGNDTLIGNGHATTMLGEKGNDSYTVTGVGDIVIEKPGEGTDTVSTSIDYRLTDNVEMLRMMSGGLTGYGNALDNRLIGSSGDDTLHGEGGSDLLQGGDGNDRLYGGTGDDDLRGEGGNDILYGGDGTDKLSGGIGNDILYGDAGNDQLRGGEGMDRLFGGAGADSFIFVSADFAAGRAASIKTIEDYSAAQGDKINLVGIDAKVATTADDKFKFIGTGAFTKSAGELRYEVVNGSAHVLGDVNGDGVADMQIVLTGVRALMASDFVL